MAQVQYEVTYTEGRNRLTCAFRIILAIPHLLIIGAWQNLIYAASAVQWFHVLFTGRRSEGIFNLQNQWIAAMARTYGYAGLLFDQYPKFGLDPSGVPTVCNTAYEAPANRLTNAFRIILAIPALIVTVALTIAAFVVSIIHWFAILFTGKSPRGMWNFVKRTQHYAFQTNAYVVLMTDTYPKY